jgi:hypothetical protein
VIGPCPLDLAGQPLAIRASVAFRSHVRLGAEAQLARRGASRDLDVGPRGQEVSSLIVFSIPPLLWAASAAPPSSPAAVATPVIR